MQGSRQSPSLPPYIFLVMVLKLIVFEPVRNRHPPNPSSTAWQMPGLMSRWHLCVKKRSSSPSSCWTQLLTQTEGLASGVWAGFQPFTPLLQVPLSRSWPTQVYLAALGYFEAKLTWLQSQPNPRAVTLGKWFNVPGPVSSSMNHNDNRTLL